MGVHIYCIKKDYVYKTAIKNRALENEWVKLEADGTIIVKGTNRQGYAWDGCSPKIKIKDIYFGTPEAVLNFNTGQSKTYYASLIHDVLYQFNKDIKPPIKRIDADREFYCILKKDNFRFAAAYYRAVRVLGWLYWQYFKNHRK
ncbi:MAG: hypothetical protein JW946_06405 [Candidatus Omnitrophica bacterium]|nr:hypothetical protein [Candidatus Omnitrophota bacterium]